MAAASRYTEEKRVVFHKDVGPLISMQEMSRCIHCTRCVRFGQEVAGVMELGMIHRGEHSEITTVTGATVDSELSGNMIDICPVGALTSKPFRYSARTWELARRKSISPHDSTGANLIVQIKANKVMRVVPLENEDVNECWIADRDRFSYEALNGDSRLTHADDQAGRRVAGGGLEHRAGLRGRWLEAHQERIRRGRHRRAGQCAQHGRGTVPAGAAGARPGQRTTSTTVCAMPTPPIAAPAGAARWLGQSIASLSTLNSALVIGSFLRKDHPLFAQRLRQAARKGAASPQPACAARRLADADGRTPGRGAGRMVVDRWPRSPPRWPRPRACRHRCRPTPALQAQAVAQSLLGGEHKALLLGNAAAQHPQAVALLALSQWIGEHTGATVGYLGEAANSVGAQLVGALPGEGGLNAAQMLSRPMKALLLLNLEPGLDAADPVAADAALQGSGLVVALTSFKDVAVANADVLLPIAPFTETAGCFVNAEGRAQAFSGVVAPLGETRPAWKVLRVLGNLLDLPGFDFDSAEQVRAAALGDMATLADRLDNRSQATLDPAGAAPAMLQRIADVPIYATDMLVRRAEALQHTADARAPHAGLPSALWQQLDLKPGDKVRVSQGGASIVLPAREETSLAANAVHVSAGRAETAALGAMFGTLNVERA